MNSTRTGLSKMALLLIFFLILSVFTSEESFADSNFFDGTSPSFERIDRDSGLSNLSVSSIIQDRYGFLWFGTQGGLNRYDGRNIKIFRNNPFEDVGLVHNLIQTMYYDEKLHELWIGTYQGVSRFYIDNNSFKNYTVEDDGLSNSVVIAITIDEDGYIWMGTMEGLNRLEPKTGAIKKYDIPGNVVRSLKIDTQGRLYIGSYEGLLYYDNETDSIKHSLLDLPSPFVMVIQEFEKGILTLGLWDGGVVEVDLETRSIESRRFEDDRVYSLLQTNDGTQWVGTWGGGLFATTKDGKKYHFPGEGSIQSLSHPVVYSMLQDHSDILWIGTNGGGLCKVNPRKSNYVQFTHDLEDPNSLSAGKINNIFRDSDQNLWFAIYNAGLNRYDPVTQRMIKYKHDPKDPHSLSNDSIVDILETKDKRLLLGTGAGLAYYDMNTDKFYPWSILPEEVIVYSIAESDESELWIGTYRNGVYRYNTLNGKIQQYHYKDNSNYSLSDNLVFDVLVDAKQRIWVGTNNGLNLLKPGEESFEIFRRVSGDYTQLPSNTIRVLFEDSKGRIWIGMVGGGIALYNEEDGTFQSFIEEDGLSNNVVTGILEGEDGRIWAATHNGISIITPESGEIFVLTPDDGIGGWEFNAGHFRDVDGTLLFGGIHGISGIPGKLTDIDLEPSRVYITNIDLYQKPIDANRLFFNDAILDFGYKDTFLGFKFAALDFDAPEKTRFSYKLEGFDKDWINGGIRDYASYSNLPPGEYELMVVAETARGVRSKTARVYFTIASPWYKTHLAYFLYGIVFLLVFLGIFKIKEGQLINQRNSELAKINRKLEEANGQLENLSTKDPLTGLFNRRYFDSMIEEQLHLARRSNTYITLIMLDIDNFKEINDHFGHMAGDYFLKDMGRVITESLPRSTDFVARYGGDEFIILLYDTEESGACKVAEKIKGLAETVTVRTEFTSSDESTTISMGLINIVPNQDITSKIIIQAADEALYSAKKEGRNRICVGQLNSEQKS